MLKGPLDWSKLSREIQDEFSMNGSIKVYDWYIDESNNNDIEWSDDYIKSFIKRFTPINIRLNQHGQESYNNASLWHCMAFEKYNIKNKKIAIIGSQTPWIESILINFENTDITTVEYNVPRKNSFIKTISYEEFIESDETYDIIVSYSSIEHSGLGRYGDIIDPKGDVKTVDHIHRKLHTDGLFFLGIPIGKDGLSWNAHRIYGTQRLNIICKNFTELEWIGVDKSFLYLCNYDNNGPQPIIVLKK